MYFFHLYGGKSKRSNSKHKIERVKELEDIHGQAIASEGVDANYMDIINYAVFGAIRLKENGTDHIQA